MGGSSASAETGQAERIRNERRSDWRMRPQGPGVLMMIPSGAHPCKAPSGSLGGLQSSVHGLHVLERVIRIPVSPALLPLRQLDLFARELLVGNVVQEVRDEIE